LILLLSFSLLRFENFVHLYRYIFLNEIRTKFIPKIHARQHRTGAKQGAIAEQSRPQLLKVLYVRHGELVTTAKYLVFIAQDIVTHISVHFLDLGGLCS